MLVISRRIGESFTIGEDIVATVVDITGEKVILGVEAPKSVPIVRFEPPAGKKPDINSKGYGRQYKKSANQNPNQQDK